MRYVRLPEERHIFREHLLGGGEGSLDAQVEADVIDGATLVGALRRLESVSEEVRDRGW